MSNSEEKIIHQVELPVKLDPASVTKRLRFRNASNRLEEMARELADMALAAARPRAIYQVSRVLSIDGAIVDIDGIRFTSRVLSKNLVNQNTVYPFIATAGRELDELPVPATDVMRRFCLDVIKTVVLVSGIDYLSDYLKEKYSIDSAALMNPGEIDDWPLAQQKPLFALFGGAESQIGVALSESGVMKPMKSRSGILFPNDTGFLSCLLCTQFKCPGRRAAYNPELVKEYLG
ncbi:MAG TPA: hypothetical protein VMW86_05855 [Dehalococcoidales bacterium]|nr:hypothetical protein [Dehalococcoidales bacterium]